MKMMLSVSDDEGNCGWADVEPKSGTMSDEEYAVGHLLPAYKHAMHNMAALHEPLRGLIRSINGKPPEK